MGPMILCCELAFKRCFVTPSDLVVSPLAAIVCMATHNLHSVFQYLFLLWVLVNLMNIYSMLITVKWPSTSVFYLFIDVSNLVVQPQEIKPEVCFVVFYLKNGEFNYTLALRRQPSTFYQGPSSFFPRTKVLLFIIGLVI